MNILENVNLDSIGHGVTTNVQSAMSTNALVLNKQRVSPLTNGPVINQNGTFMFQSALFCGSKNGCAHTEAGMILCLDRLFGAPHVVRFQGWWNTDSDCACPV